MSIAGRLTRYGEFARFLAKYGRGSLAIGGSGPRDADSSEDAAQFARDIESLGPTFIKLGQLLSTRADVLPPAYVQALERLQDDLQPFAFADVVRIVEADLGVRLSKAFAAFDEVPLAAASLGQVHRAVLRTGREVAVKVQRPNVREQVIGDLEALDELAPLLERFTSVTRSVDVPRVLEEFRGTMLRELDYRQEARNLAALAEQLSDLDLIVVPLPVDDYTGPRVLTMDYLPGTKITKVSGVEWTEVDSAALADQLFRGYLHQLLVDGAFTPTRTPATCY